MDLRKIDALVAERVMGWTSYFRDTWDCIGDQLYPSREFNRWRPTTDGNDMLAVIERVFSIGYWTRCEITEGGCSVRFAPTARHPRLQIQSYTAQTFPLAVSLSALRLFLTPEEFAEVTR